MLVYFLAAFVNLLRLARRAEAYLLAFHMMFFRSFSLPGELQFNSKEHKTCTLSILSLLIEM
jgi:hypothetical protein